MSTYLYDYLQAIHRGEILAGEELRCELENLIEDMQDSRYIYDTTDADERIDFMENCIRLTKSPFYGRPMKLMLWQKAFIETLYSFKLADQTFTDSSGQVKHVDRFQKAVLLISRKNCKALALDTKIPTPNGDKTIKDIFPGDYVFDENGKPVQVVGVSEIFKSRPCYEIVFEDGETIICDESHKWTVQTKETRKRAKYKPKTNRKSRCTHSLDEQACVTLRTFEMAKDFKRERADGKGTEYKYRVPTLPPLDGEKKEVSPRKRYKYIVDIKPVEPRDTKCISVNSARGLFLCGEKNTVTHNSETCSALTLTESVIGNEGSDLVCSSNDDMQASILYDAIDVMRLMIDPEQRDTGRNQRCMKILATNSKIFKLSDRTRNKEGRNIDFAVIDEVHEMKENTIIKSIEQSQSLKDNPKLIIITTEGFVNDGALDEILRDCRRVINKEDDGVAAERLLPWLYTQDSEQEIWQDPKTWQKSNPSLGIVKKWSYLETQIDLARKSKSDRAFVLAKDFNIKQSNALAWLNIEDYNYNARFNLEDFRNAFALGAVDLSETTDMTSAKILLMRKDDRKKYIYSHYWIPESKLKDANDKEAGAKYKEWAKAGLLTICEGNDIDLSLVGDWFFKLYKDFGIKTYKCGYDVRFSKDFLKRMDEYGLETELVWQNKITLSNAVKLCEADLKAQYVNYNENEIDRWCLSNSALELDSLGNCQVVKMKGRSSHRIDGAVTLVILYEMYRRYRSEFSQILK